MVAQESAIGSAGKGKARKIEDEGDLEKTSIIADLKKFIDFMYINNVPSYGNSFFYSLGFLLITCFAVLGITGIIMVVFGPFWWDTTSMGIFVKSIHFWAAEAFFTLLVLHLFVVFSTSAFKSNKIPWLIGSIMLFLVMLEAAFGIGLTGDFVAQWNSLSGADLWNGVGLGYWINPLNYGALYGWHIAAIPLLLLGLILVHYMLVKIKGVSKPYRKDILYSVVEADHKKLYMRASVVVLIILAFAFLFRVPYTPPMTIQNVASDNSSVLAATLVQELNHSSGTSTYLDTIDPYTFNTSQVFVVGPYFKYLNITGDVNEYALFSKQDAALQEREIDSSYDYFANGGAINASNFSNPVISMISSLVIMAQSGTYGSVLNSEQSSRFDQTYSLRLLSDTGLMDKQATIDNLQIDQFGMIRISTSFWPPGTWWVAPYNILEIIFPNGTDLQDGSIALAAFIIFLLFPFIPYINRIPDKLGLYKIFWNRFTIPEMRKKK